MGGTAVKDYIVFKFVVVLITNINHRLYYLQICEL